MFLLFAARLSTVLVLLSVAACAYTESVPVVDGTERGFTYPICYPFLVVSGANTELLLVPNPNRQRAARFGAFLAKNELDVTFEKCGPAHLKSTMDSTGVAIALLNSLTEAQKAGKLFGADANTGGTGQTFQVFEFVFDRNGTYVGLKPQISQNDFVRVHVSGDGKKAIAATKPDATKSGTDLKDKLKDPVAPGTQKGKGG